MISRLENEEYGKVTLQTLLDIAERLDIALVVRFVDFPTYIQRNTDFSDAAAAPRSYRETNRHMTLTEHNIQDEPSTALRAFLKSSYEQTFSSSLTKAVNEQNGAQNRATGWINQYRQLSGDRTNAANKLSQFSQSVDVLETHYVNNAREHAA